MRHEHDARKAHRRAGLTGSNTRNCDSTATSWDCVCDDAPTPRSAERSTNDRPVTSRCRYGMRRFFRACVYPLRRLRRPKKPSGVRVRKRCPSRLRSVRRGIIAVADPIKATTPVAIESLRANAVRIVMLTGGNCTTAQAVATKLGITEIRAEVLPERKNEIVRHLRKGRSPSLRRRATASMMHPRWRGPMWESRWAPGPMSQWQVPA